MGRGRRGPERLTKRLVESLPCPEKGSRYVGDSEVPGFCLRVWKGAKRTERAYVYRWTPRGGGGLQFVTIGGHGEDWADPVTGEHLVLTADLAREEARRLRGIRNAGGDPKAAYRKEPVKPKTETPTLREFAPVFLARHVELHRAVSTAKGYRYYLTSYILPLTTLHEGERTKLGDLPLDAIGPEHVSDLQASLAAHPTMANRSTRVLSILFTIAERFRVLPRGYPNPCRGLPHFKEGRRKRFLSAEEITRVGQALRWFAKRPLTWDDRDREKPPLTFKLAALKVLMLVGARPHEIVSLRWDQLRVEGDHGLVVVKAKRGDTAGERVILLPPDAVQTIKALPQEGEWIFQGRPGHYLSTSALGNFWREVREKAGVPDVVMYSATRHTFGGTSAGRGESLRVLGEVMGHSNPQTTQIYAHVGATPAQRASDETAALIAKALKG